MCTHDAHKACVVRTKVIFVSLNLYLCTFFISVDMESFGALDHAKHCDLISVIHHFKGGMWSNQDILKMI